jgi:hypothetical protein
MVTSHGWHGSLEEPDPDAAPRARLTLEVEMRGRGRSSGKADLSGWELQDWIDAVEFAKREYAEHISDPECVYAEGGSGAGGNVYAIVGKFPDYFSAAIVRSGMSDYALQCELDEIGEFREDCVAWIGGTPGDNPEGYRSRGGITTVRNLLTPLHIDHGETDVRVTIAHARRYVAAARALGRTVKYLEWPDVGDRRHWSNFTPEQDRELAASIETFLTEHQKPPVLPAKAELVVAGYVKTRAFEIVLDDIDRIGKVAYDLSDPARPRFDLAAKTSRVVRVRYRWSQPELPVVYAGEKRLVLRQTGAFVEVEAPGEATLRFE